ncbi:hypothetical protein JXQ31_11295 [candidate division KSB1 bacterium]|nr:hypothetical protein [candidate division KSB1 bacterium]
MKITLKRSKKRKCGSSLNFTVYYYNAKPEHFTKRCSDQEAERIHQRINDRIAAGTFDIIDFTVPQQRKINLFNFFTEYLDHRERKFQLNDIKKSTLDADEQAAKIFVKTLGPKTCIDDIDEDAIDK